MGLWRLRRPRLRAPVHVRSCRLVVVSASEPSRMLPGCLRVQTSCSFLNSLLEKQGQIRSIFFPLLLRSGDRQHKHGWAELLDSELLSRVAVPLLD